MDPVVMKGEVEYLREFGLLEEVKVALRLAGLSADDRRFLIRNEFYRSDGKLAAQVTSAGGWLDLRRRKLVVSLVALLCAVASLTRTADSRSLPSIVE
jgi:acyl-CoA thioester hydrolase